MAKTNKTKTKTKTNNNNNKIEDVASFIKDNNIEKEAFELLQKKANQEITNISNIENKSDVNVQRGIIGIPHMGTFPYQTTMSLTGLLRPQNTIVQQHMIGSCLVYDARDQILQYAEDTGADWVLMIDSDMVIPQHALVKFVETTLDGNKLDMVTGMCFKRTYPHQPCFYTKALINHKTLKPELETPIAFEEKGVMEIQGCGMACTFIRRNVWQKIKQKTGHWFFPFPGIGEDLSFCLRARMAGIKMYVDLSIDVGHVAEHVVYKNTFYAARDKHLKENPTKPLFSL